MTLGSVAMSAGTSLLLGSTGGGKVDDASNTIINQTKKADFYVKPNGDVVPSTGYRYMSSEADYIEVTFDNKIIPKRENGGSTYFSFDRFDSPQPGKLQVPHDAAVVGAFDTLQIIDDIHVPKGKWGEADWLEPVTKDFPKYGEGGATQVITYSNIKLDNVKDLRSFLYNINMEVTRKKVD